MHAAVHGEREGEVGEGVEAHARVTALFTRHVRLELPVEQVDHNRLVSLQVVLPRLETQRCTSRFGLLTSRC